MNIENVNKAISVMERVKARGDKVDMSDWQNSEFGFGDSEQDLHTCGTAACFAGWLAVSPEWAADGGSVTLSGAPKMGGYFLLPMAAVAAWLGIGEHHCNLLCGSVNGLSMAHPLVYPGFNLAEVGVDEVLTALYRLRDTGSVYL